MNANYRLVPVDRVLKLVARLDMRGASRTAPGIVVWPFCVTVE